MLTPHEISEKTFDRTFGFGYRMDSVDQFLEKAAAALQEQIDKNADLEKKLQILADKLTEYRNDEESLRTALLGAQKLGDSVIRESKTKAEIIMRDANIKAETIVGNAKRQIEREQESFERLQDEVASFKNRLVDLYKQHLELISTLPGKNESPIEAAEAAEREIDEAPEAAEPQPAAEQPAAEQPVSAAEETVSFEPPVYEYAPHGSEQMPAPETPAADADEDGEPLFSSSKFGELRFGDAFRFDDK